MCLGRCVIVAALVLLMGCVVPKEAPPAQVNYRELVSRPMPPQQSQAVAKEAVENWYYGQGLGDTALKAGTAVAFPPYILVLLGNAALSLSGYETVGVSNFLPQEGARAWGGFYDSVTGAPGRVTAAAAGREFRTPELAKEKIAEQLSQTSGEPPGGAYQ